MDQKWFISSTFGVFLFHNFCNFFYVTSYTLSGDEYNGTDSKVWESDRNRLPFLQDNFQNNFRGANGDLTEQPASENKRWLNVLTFDKHSNLTETDKGTQNETKKVFINTEEHLKIFEDEHEEEEEDKNNFNTRQLQEGKKKYTFHLLSPDGFFSEIISQDQSRTLDRTKRQAEDEKKRCRCRRNRRRGMNRRRRRRRRNRTGQQNQARRRRRGRRRNGRRRGRRRCVCKKKENGEGKSEDGEGKSEDGEGKSEDGEEPEVEEADGEDDEGTTEGGDETTTEEDGGEEEGSEEESDEEEDDEEDGEEKEDSSASEEEMPSLNNIPTYVLPYPNMIETPIAVVPVERVPTGSYPTNTFSMNRIPSYLAVGALLSKKNNSNTEE